MHSTRTWASLVALFLSAAPVAAQDVYTWNATTSSGAWLNPANWSGPDTVFPGATLNGDLSNGATDDIAFISSFNFTASNGLGINLGPAGADGQLFAGAIHFDSATANLRIGSSNGSGTLTLFGGTINSVSNVLLANTSGSRDLTIANTASGTGSQTMSLELGVANGVFLAGTGRTITVNSVIIDSGAGRGFKVQGGGTVVTTAASTFSGAVTISAGVLSTNLLANGANASGIGRSSSAAASLVLNGGALRYTGAAVSTNRLFTLTQNSGTLDASGTGALTLAAAGSVALTGSGARSLTLAGTNTALNTFTPVLGDGTGGATSLIKTGAGAWTLTGANTYTGTTTVSAGTLAIGTGGSLAAGSAVAVNSSGTLSGTGTVNGVVAVASGGTLSPGASGSGTLSIGGNTVINNGATLAIGAGAVGTNSGVAIQGSSTTFDFKSGSSLDLALLSGFGLGGNYTIVAMPSGSGANIFLNGVATTNGQVFGTFVEGTGASGPVTILPSGFSLAAGDTFTLSRSGNAVVLSFQPVPEPATALGIAAGTLGLGALVRRRLRGRASLAG